MNNGDYMKYDVIIIGAGASGMMCASALKIKNKKIKILLLEKNNKLGKKLSITGNGRCNLGNDDDNIINYHSNSDINFFKNIIENNNYILNVEDNCLINYISYLKEIGVLITKENGRLYPYSMQALSVCKSFERFLIDNGVDIKYNYEVNKVEKTNNTYIINSDYESDILVIATGGISYPKTGSTGDGYSLLKKFNHNITDLYPSLINLKTSYKYIKDLQGVRVNALCKLIVNDEIKKEEFGQVQFTKDSISRICIFNLSRDVKRYIKNNKKVSISMDLISDLKGVKDYLKQFENYKIQNALSCILNNKIAFVVSKQNKILDNLVKELSEKQINSIVSSVKQFMLEIVDTGIIDEAQVTNGGADLNDFNDNLESKKSSGLYAIGEILDVDADCGGYNLAWAFKSAILVASDIFSKLV